MAELTAVGGEAAGIIAVMGVVTVEAVVRSLVVLYSFQVAFYLYAWYQVSLGAPLWTVQF